MMRFVVIAMGALALAGPAVAVPGGKLMTLPKGSWTCELPGDANAMPTAQPASGFETIADSSYLAPDGTTGSYLRLADRLTLTSGVFAGRRFVIDGEEILREIASDDKPTGLRCVHAGPVGLATPG